MSEVIRVLHVIGIMNRGGAEAMIMNLYRNIDRNKIQFDFVENTFEKAAFDDEIKSLGGRIYNCPHYNGKNHFEYKKWWNKFFEEHSGEYRIIHGHLGSTAAIYLKIAKKYGLYTIAHSHNTLLQKDFESLLYKIYSFPTRYTADHFFTCSRMAGVSRFGKKIGSNEKLCTLLHNSIETDKFLYNIEVRNKVRNSLELGDNLVIGHVGRFNPQKNHEFLIDIYSRIHRKNKNTILLLVGDGSQKEKIFNKVKDLSLLDSVKFLGVREDINELMQAMDVFLFPSLYEGLPVTVIEAQAASLPCVISDCITKECKLLDNVKFVSLDSPIEEWSDAVFKISNIERRNTKKDIVNSHYDIEENVRWLEDFYLEKCKK